MAGFTIRRAKASDAGAIARVHVASWQAGYRGLLADEALAQLSVDAREQTWLQALADQDERQGATRVDVALAGGSVIGFVSAGPSRECNSRGQSGEIYAIYVHPTNWSAGVGQALLYSALSHLASLGLDCALLWVLASNARARRFYELAGWTADGRMKTTGLVGLPDFDAEVEEVCYQRDLRRAIG